MIMDTMSGGNGLSCCIPQLSQRYGTPLLCLPSGKITYPPSDLMSTPGSQPRTLGITKPGGDA